MSESRPHLLVTEWVSSVAIALAAYHLPWIGSNAHPAWWIVELGSLALFFSESGVFLAADYYRHRNSRGREDGPRTLTHEMNPPQLVLKGAWGSYLMAFLFCVVLFLALRERGWAVPIFGAAGLALGQPNLKLPFFMSSVGRVWVPWMAGSYLAISWSNRISIILALALFFMDLGRRRWLK